STTLIICAITEAQERITEIRVSPQPASATPAPNAPQAPAQNRGPVQRPMVPAYKAPAPAVAPPRAQAPVADSSLSQRLATPPMAVPEFSRARPAGPAVQQGVAAPLVNPAPPALDTQRPAQLAAPTTTPHSSPRVQPGTEPDSAVIAIPDVDISEQQSPDVPV